MVHPSYGTSSLSRPIRLSPSGFRLFAPRFRGTFQLFLTVLVRYRTRGVFRVRCLMSPRFPHHIQDTVLGIPNLITTRLTPTGLSPSMAPRSRGLRICLGGIGSGSTTPHPYLLSEKGSVCSIPLSLAGTHGIPIGFSSSGY